MVDMDNRDPPPAPDAHPYTASERPVVSFRVNPPVAHLIEAAAARNRQRRSAWVEAVCRRAIADEFNLKMRDVT